jgi:NADH-quinone oxidoreductase subunit L
MDAQNYVPLLFIPLLPLLGAMWNGLAGHRMPEKTVGIVASALPIVSFLIGLVAFRELRGMPVDDRVLEFTAYSWIDSGVVQIPLAFRFDPLTAVMVLVVTGVGSLIHVYSIGYMAADHEPTRNHARYFAYLNLFTFAMLMLVMANNLVVMFVGWEGVGVCSYLLIGFWYHDMDKAIAGKKAFIVNRIGDFGFLLGFFVLFWTLHSVGTATAVFYETTAEIGGESVRFAGLAEQMQLIRGATIWGMPVPAVVGVLLFVGACGKSAQLPLYVWLPDAMAGPTPVSALIHAATMVTAGVYMVARMSFLYSLPEAHVAAGVVAGVGAVTALFAATMGLFQHDIKKVLAYSTVSQLGFMFVGVGVGAYSAGIFHLMTHAFFKALLFLGAGSVIVGMHHQQDIRKMGGLLKKMPVTGWTFIAAFLAIIGFPGLSGFFSKDEILHAAHANGFMAIYVIGLAGAMCTAFYMTRLVIVTFFGELRLSEEELHHMPGHDVHESPQTMTIPLVILAILSVVGGWIGINEGFGGGNQLHHWLAPVVGAAAAHAPAHGEEAVAAAHGMSVWLGGGIAVAVAAVGAALAYSVYVMNRSAAVARSELFLSGPDTGGFAGDVYRLVNAKYKVDEIYDALIVRPIHHGSRDILWPFDKWVVDGAVNMVADVVKAVGGILGFVQNGNVKRYLVGMAFGVAVVIVVLVVLAPALDSIAGGS